ncbi:class I SAM-dependent methyltransferase [Neotabrizicola shimadae]|uniref:Class I SAM-dependent methyltransferase n=1 Tax=Neotabrizicola shimadae TaxID=2807096 RepID=A0A8G0ZW98_9RHOB|nr:class I SAM-dependent methyltransferase [Neotabrizicola shimadae]QYZ70041.1 class I SAM-dependent methyltransferase [Neotabrizicola shimadae]
MDRAEPRTGTAAPLTRRPVLYNLGSGPRRLLSRMPKDGPFAGWSEVTVDLDPGNHPDIVADIADLSGAVADGAADLIWCSHVLEHFHDHQIPAVLAGFLRILAPDGAAVIRVPDLAQVMRRLDETDLERVLYTSPAGPVSVLDVIYGHRASVEAGNLFMAHRTGFTEVSLARRMLEAGFEEVQTHVGDAMDFWAVGYIGSAANLKLIGQLIGPAQK